MSQLETFLQTNIWTEMRKRELRHGGIGGPAKEHTGQHFAKRCSIVVSSKYRPLGLHSAMRTS